MSILVAYSPIPGGAMASSVIDRGPHAAARSEPMPSWSARVDCAAKSDVGLHRNRNEDDYAVLLEQTGCDGNQAESDECGDASVWAQSVSLIVADGLGGHGDGDKASAEAVRFMSSYASRILPLVAQTSEPCDAHLGDGLRRTMRRLHEHITRKADDCHWDPAMGTTLTFCHVSRGVAHIAHAGDSRCYVLRDGHFIQLTTDHTIANMLIARGLLDAGQAPRHLESALCNCLGGGVKDAFAEVRHVPLRAGDVLLVCSDGLTKHVPDEDIARMLTTDQSAPQSCERLVRAANARGGTDNITVAVCRFIDLCEEAARPATAARVAL